MTAAPVRTALFTGKGGVGKTTMAAATAVAAAAGGARTLVLSTDPAHSLADVLGLPLTGEPTAVGGAELPGLHAAEVDVRGVLEPDQLHVGGPGEERAHVDPQHLAHPHQGVHGRGGDVPLHPADEALGEARGGGELVDGHVAAPPVVAQPRPHGGGVPGALDGQCFHDDDASSRTVLPARHDPDPFPKHDLHHTMWDNFCFL